MANDERESVGDHFPHFATEAIHAGQDPDQWTSKSVVPLISLSTTFKQETPGKPVSYIDRLFGNGVPIIYASSVASTGSSEPYMC